MAAVLPVRLVLVQAAHQGLQGLEALAQAVRANLDQAVHLVQIETAIDNATLAEMKTIIKRGFKVLYNLQLWRKKVIAEARKNL